MDGSIIEAEGHEEDPGVGEVGEEDQSGEDGEEA